MSTQQLCDDTGRRLDVRCDRCADRLEATGQAYRPWTGTTLMRRAPAR